MGSGPNGLAAALTLARAGHAVEVFEGAPTVGGGTRTEALTLDGLPSRRVLGRASRAGRLPLLPHPRPARARRRAAPARAGLRASARGRACRRAVPQRRRDGGTTSAATPLPTGISSGPLVDWLDRIVPYVLGPMRSRCRSDPLALARFAPRRHAARCSHAARRFSTDAARALLAGAAAHSMEPLTAPLTSAFGLLLTALGHGVGWPVVEGGSAAITQGLAAEVRRLGGVVHTGHWVTALAELPPARAVLLDTSPRQFVALAGPRLSRRAARPWARFRPGPGACKVDWALDGPVPWSAEACRRTVTVHVGGHLRRGGAGGGGGAGRGGTPRQPFVLVAQPGVVDPTRAPAGRSTLWGYCHVPNGSGVDMSERMEAQIERFAPGFRDRVLARAVRTADEAESHNPNLLGGRRQRRCRHAAPDGLPARGPLEPLPDAARGRVSLLGLDATGGRRARDVRAVGGPGGAAGALRADDGQAAALAPAVSCARRCQASTSSATQDLNSPSVTT